MYSYIFFGHRITLMVFLVKNTKSTLYRRYYSHFLSLKFWFLPWSWREFFLRETCYMSTKQGQVYLKNSFGIFFDFFLQFLNCFSISSAYTPKSQRVFGLDCSAIQRIIDNWSWYFATVVCSFWLHHSTDLVIYIYGFTFMFTHLLPFLQGWFSPSEYSVISDNSNSPWCQNIISMKEGRFNFVLISWKDKIIPILPHQLWIDKNSTTRTILTASKGSWVTRNDIKEVVNFIFIKHSDLSWADLTTNRVINWPLVFNFWCSRINSRYFPIFPFSFPLP